MLQCPHRQETGFPRFQGRLLEFFRVLRSVERAKQRSFYLQGQTLRPIDRQFMCIYLNETLDTSRDCWHRGAGSGRGAFYTFTLDGFRERQSEWN